MNKAKRPKEGFFLGIVFGLIVILGTFFFFKPWLPDLVSNRGEIDSLFYTILIITGVAFILVQSITGYFIWRYSDPTPERAEYFPHNKTLEITWTVVTALILCSLSGWGLMLWKKVATAAPPENAYVVEVTGQQFQWNVRYPGSDGKFGRTLPGLISDSNPLGLDDKDPHSKDDIVAQDDLYLVVNKPVLIRIRAKDVLHSFFLPNFRVKQDAIPGMTVSTWFIPTKVGDYEIACAQLCGLGHYTMRGQVHVVTEDDFNKKLRELKSASLDTPKIVSRGDKP